MCVRRRRRERDSLPPLEETELAREGFTRIGEVKGLIIDENGVDVLYLRKLQSERDDKIEEKNVIYSKDKLKLDTVMEVGLLRGRSSSSQSVIHNDNHRNATTTHTESFEFVKLDSSPPPIPVKQNDPAPHFPLIRINQNALLIPVNQSELAPPPPSISVKQSELAPPLPPIPVKQSVPVPPLPIPVNQSDPVPPPPIPVNQSEPSQSLPISVNQSAPAIPPPIPVNQSEPEPPLPIPVNQSEPDPPPPPMTISTKNGTSPPPPPFKNTETLSSLSTKPPQSSKESSAEEGSTSENGLKPLQWDKVNTNSNHSMDWNKSNRGSISFDNDLMEALFGYVAVKKKPLKHNGDKQIFILNPRKSHSIANELKSLEITHENLAKSLTKVNDFHPETLERLIKLAPTKEEQSEILNFDGDATKLAATESFLFHLLKSTPFAFTRLKALLFRANYYPEISHYKKSLQTLNSACTELRSRGLLVKLIETILKSGNKLNTGDESFNLTAVLKLSGVKSLDGNTTLLNYVVEEVVKSESKRHRSNSTSEQEQEQEQEQEYLQLGLEIVAGLTTKFINVKKSADINFKSVSALASKAKDTRRVLSQCGEEEEMFVKKMMEFLDTVDEEVKLVREEEKKVMEIVKRITECYYQGGDVKEKNLLCLFVIVRDFLEMVDEVCVEIGKKLERRVIESFQKRNPVKFPVLYSDFMLD